jgi:hypothetical protein
VAAMNPDPGDWERLGRALLAEILQPAHSASGAPAYWALMVEGRMPAPEVLYEEIMAGGPTDSVRLAASRALGRLGGAPEMEAGESGSLDMEVVGWLDGHEPGWTRLRGRRLTSVVRRAGAATGVDVGAHLERHRAGSGLRGTWSERLRARARALLMGVALKANSLLLRLRLNRLRALGLRLARRWLRP